MVTSVNGVEYISLSKINNILKQNIVSIGGAILNPNVTPTPTPSPIGSTPIVMINGGFNTINTSTRNFVGRVNPDGTTDTTWPELNETGFNGIVTSKMARQSNGLQIYGGAFTTYNSVTQNYISRLNTDGSLDTTFNSGGNGFNAQINSLVVNSDDSIVAVGAFTTYNGVSANRIIKLNSDGSINGTFNYGSGFDNSIEWIEKNGNYYYIGGTFTTYNGISYLRFIVLDDNGNVVGPSVGNGANGTVFSIVIDSSGNNAYIGGDFTTWNGSSVAADLIKVSTSSWSVDTTFNTNINGGTNNSVRALLYDNTTNVLYIGGNYTSFAGNTTTYGIRLTAINSDGTSYTSFNNSRTSPGNYVRRMSWSNLNSNNFYIMGAFLDYGGDASKDRIALLSKTDGTIQSFVCNVFGGPNQEPFWANDFNIVGVVPSPTPTPSITPTLTPTPSPVYLSFQQTDTTFTNGNSAACSGRVAASVVSQETAQVGGIAGTATQTVTLTSSQTNVWGYQTKVIVPANTNWNAGTWTWRLNVTTANMNLTLTEVHICRVNSSNINQATIGSATNLGLVLTTTGVKSGTITGISQTPNVGDYVNIVFVFTNGAMSTQSTVITHNQIINSPYI